jgi:hypothetical protein
MQGWGLVLFFAALGAGQGQPGASPFEETTYSAGEVKKGERIVHAFVLRNTGEVPLEVRSVAPT